MSYMAAAARYTANCTQHSRYTTRNTTRYTTRNTTKMLSRHSDQNEFARVTEILHHLSSCHSTLSLGVRGYKLCISKSKVIEVVQDFFHPPKKEKDFLHFWSCKFLPVTSYFQGIKSIVRSSYSSPSVLHSSPAHSWHETK